ncbi:hypothetical protein Goshw_016067 [Gossypium schwendimanii]|uniref:Uncharacterized protein n=2 Tax=Gossypium TaxID=3633 RepID=A0A7J9L3P4_GOSSC|nr:hypothetical protein [Gossypium laxum]MBA0853323.1 hypothetical protein [Gossypium schwendimanii]
MTVDASDDLKLDQIFMGIVAIGDKSMGTFFGYTP